MAVAGQLGEGRQRALAGVGAEERSAAGVVLVETPSVALRLLVCELFWSALRLVDGRGQPAAC